MKATYLQLVGSLPKSANVTGLPFMSMGDAAQLGVRQPQELFEPDELGDEFEGRGVDGVAAEVPQEIRMLFQHYNVVALPGNEQSQNHPGRATAGDAAPRLIRPHGVNSSVLDCSSARGARGRAIDEQVDELVRIYVGAHVLAGHHRRKQCLANSRVSCGRSSPAATRASR